MSESFDPAAFIGIVGKLGYGASFARGFAHDGVPDDSVAHVAASYMFT